MRVLSRAVLIVSAAVAVACGGGGATYDSAADIVDQIDCDEPSEADMIIAASSYRCTYDGERLEIATFDTSEGRDNYAEIGRQFGGVSLQGENWLVLGPRSTLDDLQDELGGRIED